MILQTSELRQPSSCTTVSDLYRVFAMMVYITRTALIQRLGRGFKNRLRADGDMAKLLLRWILLSIPLDI